MFSTTIIFETLSFFAICYLTVKFAQSLSKRSQLLDERCKQIDKQKEILEERKRMLEEREMILEQGFDVLYEREKAVVQAAKKVGLIEEDEEVDCKPQLLN